MVDSDSSVDAVIVGDKTYRLKCDCCRSKRAETQYDFHPCKVEKCTFSICWKCLQRWKDQSDKDNLKKFECPQCHSEYNTNHVHQELSKKTITKVNAEAKKLRRQKNKRKKKREQEQKAQKASTKLSKNHHKLLRMRLEQNRRTKNKNKKKESNARKSKAVIDPRSTKTHVLNKYKVIICFGPNLILQTKWNDKMITAIFSKIGSIQSYKKTDSDLIVTYKKQQSDKARRVLLYLFDLNVSIVHHELPKNHQNASNIHAQDCFNPSMSGGKQKFLCLRDSNTNWSDYAVPVFEVVPPGGARWIHPHPKRLTKAMFIDEMLRRSTLNPRRPPQIPIMRPPPLPMMNKPSKQQPTRPTMNPSIERSKLLLNKLNRSDPPGPLPLASKSNSASALLPMPEPSHRLLRAISNPKPPPNLIRNVYKPIKPITPPPAPSGPSGPPGIAMKRIAPPGMGPVPIQRNEANMNGSKRLKIDNILRLKHKKPLPENDINIEWFCNGNRMDMRIVSSSSELSDFEFNPNIKQSIQPVQPVQPVPVPPIQPVVSHPNGNHNPYAYDDDYNYSSSSSSSSFNAPPPPPEQKRQPPPPNETQTGTKRDLKVQDMTIQQMLENLEVLGPDQVDAILAKLMKEPETKGNDEIEQDADDEEEDNLNAFECTNDEEKEPNDADLQFIAETMARPRPPPPRTSPPPPPAPAPPVLEDIQNTDPMMERYRSDMKKIALYYSHFHLSTLHNIYLETFERKLKSIYKGKLGDLVHYFTDLFSVKYNQKNNQTIVYSLVYEKGNMNGTKDVRWTPKKKEKKEKQSPIKNGVIKGNKKKANKSKKKSKSNANLDDFRYGPSQMYTYPRAAPKAHSHIIGHTAAVGTANAYAANGYSVNGRNRYTVNARSYSSRNSKRSSTRHVKTYGDYEDELPHTPSGSEDDDY
eukprot:1146368_1